MEEQKKERKRKNEDGKKSLDAVWSSRLKLSAEAGNSNSEA